MKTKINFLRSNFNDLMVNVIDGIRCDKCSH